MGKASSLGADAIIYDLEDAVAPDMKVMARNGLLELLPASGFRVIRVNGSVTPWHEGDIAAAVKAHSAALLLPKANTQEDIWAFKRLIALQHPKSSISIWAMIETPLGVLNAASIASALGPNGALVMGLNDLEKETGMQQLPGRVPMVSVLTSTVMAARAYNAAIFDGVYNDYADDSGFIAECRQGRSFGFNGKTIIHPRQIDPANTIFSPSQTEIDEAQAIVVAFDQPENSDKRVIVIGSRMVERLHLDMARSVLSKVSTSAIKGK